MQNHIKKVGFFGGTFDPIHFGHLNLAVQMQEHFKLDLIIFSCTPCSPFKLESPPEVPLEHRSVMLHEAVDEIDAFLVSDIETKFNKISYTVDALQELKKIYFDSKLFLIISDEMLDGFDKWKKSNEILKIADVVVGTREKKMRSRLAFDKVSKENFIEMPTLEISSTVIRERLKKGLYCGHLVPYKVLKYIEKQGFYRS